MSTIAPQPPRTTPRGTPCAVSWDDAWVAQVEARELAMDRRICGARTIGGKPCPLPRDHTLGRCRHHGGFPLTGAPEDSLLARFGPKPSHTEETERTEKGNDLGGRMSSRAEGARG